jgi:hypothetical protein
MARQLHLPLCGCSKSRSIHCIYELQLWEDITMGLLLLIIVLILLLGGLPTWPHSRNWGYGPSGVLGVLLVILLVMVILQLIPPLGFHGRLL